MIDVLFRSERVLVVSKPPGLLVHRSELASDSDVAMIRARDAIGQHVWPVHRLDRQTSGALVFALTEDSARELRELFDRGAVEKTYVAIVRGAPPERVHVDYAIPKGEGKERVPAITDVVRVAQGEYASLVVARPRTGRYHQIRRHMAHLRHPIANDSSYGTGWFNRKVREDTGLMRLALHAQSVTIPTKNGTIEARAPLFSDFAIALEKLGLGLPELAPTPRER